MLSSVASTAAAVPPAGISPAGPPAVLLVEDEGPLAELLANLLSRLNVSVLIAADGERALELFQRHHAEVRLAFVDCNLPDMPGPALCEKFREASPRLPLLLTSGRNQDAVEKRFSAAAPCEFLPKPYLPNEVLRRVSALLEIAS